MDHRIAAFALQSGEQLFKIELPKKGVYGLALSADGCLLAHAGSDGKIRIWEI
jgi:WD40 repeat protein